jgi:hypothetical protein
MVPVSVREPPLLVMVELPAPVAAPMLPRTVLSPDVLRSSVPLKVMEMLEASVMPVVPPSSSRRPLPLVAVTDFSPLPRALLRVMTRAPRVMVMPPVKLLSPERTTVLEEDGLLSSNRPEPLMELGTCRVPVRLNASVPSLMTGPLPRLPVEPALPICRVPAKGVMVPGYRPPTIRVVP